MQAVGPLVVPMQATSWQCRHMCRESVVLDMLEIRDFCCQTKILIRVASDAVCGCELTQITCFRVRAWFHVSLLNSCKQLEREAVEERGRKVLSHEARRHSHLFHAGFLEQRVPSVFMCHVQSMRTSDDYASLLVEVRLRCHCVAGTQVDELLAKHRLELFRCLELEAQRGKMWG